ncbi:hypothetical protein J4434_08750 [Candidatus Woesearchaeota archaeon]|nr:hypothetical protein [Candidatus Woesearchaeota archaeon]
MKQSQTQRYTEKQVGEAFERYYARVNNVRDVLRIAPQMAEYGIHTIVNVSNDFMIVNSLHQEMIGTTMLGTIEDRIVLCRELILSKHPDKPKDIPLYNIFANTPLEVEKHPFFFVAYDGLTYDYVMKNATIEQDHPYTKAMKTKRGVTFYLARENDVNVAFPMRFTLEKGMTVMLKEKNGSRKR